MKVHNSHQRVIPCSVSEIAEVLDSLSSKDDKLWPFEDWPAMRFRKGLVEGASGGHGPVKYRVRTYVPGKLVAFDFLEPVGFKGTHKFEVIEVGPQQMQITHIIDMKTSFFGTLQWVFFVRWLHDALIEDAFDKVENQFQNIPKKSPRSFWVKSLRAVLSHIT